MLTVAAKSFVVALTFMAIVLPASAATITYSVEGDPGGSAVIGEGNATGVAQSFTMNETLTDVRISFDLFCLPACEGSIYLINGLPGPGMTFSQYETDRNFAGGGSFSYVMEPLIPGWDTLTAGVTYSLVLSITVGNGFWEAVRNAAGSGDEVTLGDAFLIAGISDFDLGLPPNSVFEPWTESTPRFVITGTTAVIPLPGSLALFAGALGLLALRRRVQAE